MDNLTWRQIEKIIGEEIPNKDKSDFLAWAQRYIPLKSLEVQPVKGLTYTEKYQNAQIIGNLKNYYNYWQQLPTNVKYVGAIPTQPAYPSGAATPEQALGTVSIGGTLASSAEAQLTQTYLNKAMATLQGLVTGETLTQEQANTALMGIRADVSTYGLTSDLPYIKDTGIWSEWNNWLDRNAERITLPSGGKVLYAGGVFYNPDSTRIPQAEQESILNTLNQQAEQAQSSYQAQIAAIGAEGEQKKQFKEYFDLQAKWMAPEMEAHRSIFYRNEPPGRAAYDIVIAKDAVEARKLGYASFIPEEKWNNPKIQAIVETETLKNLSIQARRLGLQREQKTGTTSGGKPVWKTLGSEYLPSTAGPNYHATESEVDIGIAMGTAPGFWDKVAKLTTSEINMAKQMALEMGMAAAGGAQTAGIVIRDERSPFGALVQSPEEYRASYAYKTKTQMMDAISRDAIAKQKALKKSYQTYVTPEGTTSTAPTPSSPLNNYEVPGENVPKWLPQYVPGLEAGKTLKLGHYFAPLSGQQLSTLLPSQLEYLQSYTDVSKQMLGQKIPLWSFQDMLAHSKIGASEGIGRGGRWAPAMQR